MASVLETHPKRADIDAALLSGQSLVKVRQMFNLPHGTSTLQRYKKGVLVPAVIAASKLMKSGDLQPPGANSTEALVRGTKQVSAAEPIVRALAERAETRKRDMDGARESDQWGAVSAFDRNGLADLRTLAELTGALDQQQSTADARNAGVHIHFHQHEHHVDEPVNLGPIVEIEATPVADDTDGL